jgi:hypothetical protein
MQKNADLNILPSVSILNWENAPTTSSENTRKKAETRPPLSREPGSGLELTPKSQFQSR